MVMSTLPGRTLGSLWHKMTSAARIRVLREVRSFMQVVNERMVALFKGAHGSDSKPSWMTAIGDLDGTRCFEFPFCHKYVQGGFEYTSFISIMEQQKELPDELHNLRHDILTTIAPSTSDIEFCHMDLHGRNILLDGDDYRISGILDWELSGM